jgi:hypothetical protein
VSTSPIPAQNLYKIFSKSRQQFVATVTDGEKLEGITVADVSWCEQSKNAKDFTLAESNRLMGPMGRYQKDLVIVMVHSFKEIR